MTTAVCSRMAMLLPHRQGLADHRRREFDTRAGARGLRCAVGGRFALAADTAEPLALQAAPVGLLDIDPGKIRGPRMGRLATHDSRGPTAELARDCEIYNFATLDAMSLTVVSDTLGLKPLYVAELPDGVALASSLLDMLALWPQLVHPVDETALRELLAFGYPLQCRTLHARIRRTPPGATLRHAGNGLQIAEVDWTALAGQAPADMAAAVDELGRALEGAVGERVGTGPAWLGLTGGFDSRVLLGAACAIGTQVQAVTFGAEGHAEVAVARAVARRAKVSHSVVPISPTNVRDALARNINAVEASARPILSLANLIPAAPATPVELIHGFLGDALGGANLTKWGHGAAVHDAEKAASVILGANLKWRSDYETLYGLPADPSAMRDDVREGIADFPGDYRGVVLWDLHNRQRRFVSSHFRVLAEHYDVCVPYYAPQLMALYLSLPRALLERRALTRQLLCRRYPQLASVRHDEETWPMRASAGGWATGLRLSLTARFRPLRRFAPHREIIWGAPGKEISASRTDFLDAIEQRYGHLQALVPAMPSLRRAPLEQASARVVAQLQQLCDYAAECATIQGAQKAA